MDKKDSLPPNLLFLCIPKLCWCPWLDLDRGVNEENRCKICRGLVLIIHLNEYKRGTCACPGKPEVDEAFFCLTCKNAVLQSDGNPHPYNYIAVKRAVYMEKKLRKEGEKKKKVTNKNKK